MTNLDIAYYCRTFGQLGLLPKPDEVRIISFDVKLTGADCDV